MKILFDQGTPVVLLSTSWPRIQRQVDEIQRAIADSTPGRYQEITIAR
jgi:hypothetical protein